LESSISSVRIEQKSYEMPPRDGFTVTHLITVADIRSADFYEKVFGGRILSRGDSKGASGHIQIANTWLIVNVGGGPTPDKPKLTLSVPADPDKVSSFLNIRVADIRACYELWKSRGAELITEPKEKYDEIRCHQREFMRINLLTWQDSKRRRHESKSGSQRESLWLRLSVQA
jgi:uncharacterized glyoxalase superfamily protein PhnB